MIGGILLLELPDAVFDAVVPALILLAVALMALRPSPKVHEGGDNMPAGVASSFAVGIYGGYFGAAQGIILMSLLRLCFAREPAGAERDQERAGGRREPRRRHAVHPRRGRRLGRRGADRRRLGGRPQVGARYGRRVPQEILRRVVIVYGTIVAIILIIT